MNTKSLQDIIQAAQEVIDAVAGRHEDIHKEDSARICALWDDLNDRYAPPEVVKYLATEVLSLNLRMAELMGDHTKKLPVRANMTLEEAIDHCEEVAERTCGPCGDNHTQLATWLRELLLLRSMVGTSPNESFFHSLEEASTLVNTWPRWKREGSDVNRFTCKGV